MQFLAVWHIAGINVSLNMCLGLGIALRFGFFYGNGVLGGGMLLGRWRKGLGGKGREYL